MQKAAQLAVGLDGRPPSAWCAELDLMVGLPNIIRGYYCMAYVTMQVPYA